jgi:sugar phosphate isomerase/epimerase
MRKKMPDLPLSSEKARRAGQLEIASYVRAFSTLGCPELELEGALGLARAHGIAAIELRVLQGLLDLPAYFAACGESATALADKIKVSGVRVAALSTSLQLMDGTDADFKKFLEFVPWAEVFGVPWLRVFDGGKTATGAELERAVSIVAHWRELRASHGWRTDMMVETHDSLATASAISRFTRALPGIEILWDSHHTWRAGGERPADTWAGIRANVVHVHVKDSRLGRNGRPDGYVLPGTGDFPMAELKGVLAGTFKGVVSLEWERQWHPELPPLENALESGTLSAGW